MNSFDFYDTLFVRLVATPQAIFELVERISGIQNFAVLRRRAEIETARMSPHREITLKEIYERIALEAPVRDRIKELELSLEEELIVPVAENLARVDAGDLILSDMYLPRECLESVLRKYCSRHSAVTLLVSSENGFRKSDGSLWGKLLSDGMRVARHLGDNWNADVRQPRAHGLVAEHYTGTRLNRFERAYLKSGIDGNLIAGISRAARLSDADTFDFPSFTLRAIREVFCGVVAPVLVSFVELVLDDCTRRGVSVVLFLARDGQVLHRIAERLITARSLPISARYVHASRQSLHLPGYDDPGVAEEWLLEDTDWLTAETIAERAEVSAEIVVRACFDAGIENADAFANISRRDRGKLRNAVRQPYLVDAMRAAAANRWGATYEYLVDSGLRPGANVAIVDVGWSGRIQTSLRSTLRKSGEPQPRMIGYYLCLSRKPPIRTGDDLNGFIFDPDSDRGPCFLDPYRPVIESILMADHGTTIRFEMRDSKATPVLANPPEQEFMQLVRVQQQTVMRFVELMVECESKTGHRIQWPKEVVVRNLRTMLERPSTSDAVAFSLHRLSIEQGEQVELSLVKKRFFVTDLCSRKTMGLWPEGSIAANGRGPLLAVLASIRRARRVVLATRAKFSSIGR